LIWAEFKDETICDLFSEQALLCGGVSSLLRRTYEVLTEAGYNKETAYFETLFELKLIVDLIWKEGIGGMRAKISPTARYGDVTRGDRIFDEHIKSKMKEVLKEVEDGSFAKEFLEKIDSDDYKKLEDSQAKHAIEVIGKDLRARRSPN
jgi:ketol-acid reductoisomerase